MEFQRCSKCVRKERTECGKIKQSKDDNLRQLMVEVYFWRAKHMEAQQEIERLRAQQQQQESEEKAGLKRGRFEETSQTAASSKFKFGYRPMRG